VGRKAACAVALLSILLLAAALRLYRLEAQSFWNDEGNSARAAERSVPLILEAAQGDIHPPAYYLLLHVWRGLVGESEFALRAFSAFCGVLTVALTYALGRRLLGAPTALGAAFFAALSPLGVYYAQEARMYALLGLLSAASTYFLVRIVPVRRGSPVAYRLSLIAYWLSAGAGLYTHYAFPFVLAVHNLLFVSWWLVRQRGRWRALLEWAATQAAVLLAFLPWLPTALRAVTGWPSAGGGYELLPALLTILRTLTAGITLDPSKAGWALSLFGAMLLLALWPRRTDLPAVAALLTWLLLPIALILAFDLYKPAYLKFLLVVLPPFQLLVAHGAHRLSLIAYRLSPVADGVLHMAYRLAPVADRVSHMADRLAPVADRLSRTADRPPPAHLQTCQLAHFPPCILVFLLLLLPSLHNLYFNPAYARQDYRQIARDLEAVYRPGDGILLNAANQWEVFTYYHRQGAPVYPLPRSRPPRADAVAAELAEIAAAHRRLFAVYWGDAEADPQRLVESWLAGHAYPAGDRWYGEVRVAVYGLGALPEEPAVATDACFGEHICLRGYTLSSGPFAPGQVVPVTLFWQADAAIPERYKVFLHLIDASGRLVAQTDAEPYGNLMPTTVWAAGELLIDRHGVWLPADLPPGDYALLGGLYSLGGERLSVEGNGDHVLLGAITVAH